MPGTARDLAQPWPSAGILAVGAQKEPSCATGINGNPTVNGCIDAGCEQDVVATTPTDVGVAEIGFQRISASTYRQQKKMHSLLGERQVAPDFIARRDRWSYV